MLSLIEVILDEPGSQAWLNRIELNDFRGGGDRARVTGFYDLENMLNLGWFDSGFLSHALSQLGVNRRDRSVTSKFLLVHSLSSGFGRRDGALRLEVSLLILMHRPPTCGLPGGAQGLTVPKTILHNLAYASETVQKAE
jgi:hypothetical protein